CVVRRSIRGRSPASAALAGAGQTTSRLNNNPAHGPLTSVDHIAPREELRRCPSLRYDSVREEDGPSEDFDFRIDRAGRGHVALNRRQDEGVARAQRPVRRRRRWPEAPARHPRARLAARRRAPDPLDVWPGGGIPWPGGGRARE